MPVFQNFPLMKHLSLVFLFLLSCAGCINSDSNEIPDHLEGIENLKVYPSDESAKHSIQFEQARVFEESDELIFGRLRNVAVDDSGRVYISDAAQSRTTIHVFNSNGSYVSSIGGYGEGPGEFRSIISPQIHGEKLYAMDVRQMRINIYNINSFEYQNSIQLNPGNWSHIEELSNIFPSDFIVLDRNRFLLSFIKIEKHQYLHYHYLMNNSSEIISDMILDQIQSEHFELPDNRGVYHSPYSPSGNIKVSSTDEINTIWTEDVLFKKYSLNGEYKSAFYHPFSNKPLSNSEVLNYLDNEEYKAAVRNTGIPEEWPAVRSVVMDDRDNFWLETITESETENQWWVLSSDGELLSKFNFPTTKSIHAVTDDAFFALESDPDTGIQRAVKYQYRFE